MVRSWRYQHAAGCNDLFMCSEMSVVCSLQRSMSTTTPAAEKTFGPISDQDRIFQNIYGRHDTSIKVGWLMQEGGSTPCGTRTAPGVPSADAVGVNPSLPCCVDLFARVPLPVVTGTAPRTSSPRAQIGLWIRSRRVASGAEGVQVSHQASTAAPQQTTGPSSSRARTSIMCYATAGL